MALLAIILGRSGGSVGTSSTVCAIVDNDVRSAFLTAAADVRCSVKHMVPLRTITSAFAPIT